MAYSYAIYDVFTETELTGNPLAVVFDADGLDTDRMQRITKEFNLSETVFVCSAERPNHSANLRIFTPDHEMIFAGHPTVGTAIALAEAAHGADANIDLMQVLEEKIGPIRTAVRLVPDSANFAEFDLPQTSERIDVSVSKESIAAGLGLDPLEIGFENHVLSVWSAGNPFIFVPLRNMSAIATANCDGRILSEEGPEVDGRVPGVFVYCRDGINHNAAFHGRMFTPHNGVAEDPATGSAVAAISGPIVAFDGLLDGHHELIIEQGFEMGRPSMIHLHLDVENETVSKARIGGHAVKIAEGTLFV